MNLRNLGLSAAIVITSFSAFSSSGECATTRIWRGQSTHALPRTTEGVHTSPAREQYLQLRKAYQLSKIFPKSKQTGDVPEFEIVAAEGVSAEYSLPAWNVYETPKVKISGIGPSGLLAATAILPVSGHAGRQNAIQWSSVDTYNVFMTDSAGNRRDLVRNGRSLKAVTFQDLEIQLEAGRTVKIFYERSGSGGVGGFSSGRTVELTWDGT